MADIDDLYQRLTASDTCAPETLTTAWEATANDPARARLLAHPNCPRELYDRALNSSPYLRAAVYEHTPDHATVAAASKTETSVQALGGILARTDLWDQDPKTSAAIIGRVAGVAVEGNHPSLLVRLAQRWATFITDPAVAGAVYDRALAHTHRENTTQRHGILRSIDCHHRRYGAQLVSRYLHATNDDTGLLGPVDIEHLTSSIAAIEDAATFALVAGEAVAGGWRNPYVAAAAEAVRADLRAGNVARYQTVVAAARQSGTTIPAAVADAAADYPALVHHDRADAVPVTDTASAVAALTANDGTVTVAEILDNPDIVITRELVAAIAETGIDGIGGLDELARADRADNADTVDAIDTYLTALVREGTGILPQTFLDENPARARHIVLAAADHWLVHDPDNGRARNVAIAFQSVLFRNHHHTVIDIGDLTSRFSVAELAETQLPRQVQVAFDRRLGVLFSGTERRVLATSLLAGEFSGTVDDLAVTLDACTGDD